VDTATGAITRLYDKRNRRDAFAPGGRGNILQVFGDLPREWDAWDIGYVPGQEWEVTETSGVQRHADQGEARLGFTRRWGNSTFTQTLILGRETPFVDVATTWTGTRATSSSRSASPSA
jgi:alpha-mannosidase